MEDEISLGCSGQRQSTLKRPEEIRLIRLVNCLKLNLFWKPNFLDRLYFMLSYFSILCHRSIICTSNRSTWWEGAHVVFLPFGRRELLPHFSLSSSLSSEMRVNEMSDVAWGHSDGLACIWVLDRVQMTMYCGLHPSCMFFPKILLLQWNSQKSLLWYEGPSIAVAREGAG